MIPKYPQVNVLAATERDSYQAYRVLRSVRSAMREAQIAESEIIEFTQQATSGDFEALLATCKR